MTFCTSERVTGGATKRVTGGATKRVTGVIKRVTGVIKRVLARVCHKAGVDTGLS